MGFIQSKLWKKKTTSEQLESIVQKIQSIEKFQKETEQQFRRVVGKLVVSSIVIYLIAVVGYYYYYSPETFRDNMIKFLPLLVFPVMFIFLRRVLTWYYKRKLFKNETTLKMLNLDKKKILDEVMNNETYKVAREILEKYAPDQFGKDFVKPVINSHLRALLPVTPAKHETTARQRLIAANKTLDCRTREEPAFQVLPNTSLSIQPKLSLRRPILQRDRGAFDKLIDMIVGDGPANRYALICKVCSSHNGMALKHEFEYLAFRCAYCLQWNPARKQKPHAPNLLSDSSPQDDSDANESEAEFVNSVSESGSPRNTWQTENCEIKPVLTQQDSCSMKNVPEADGLRIKKDHNVEETVKVEDLNRPLFTNKVYVADSHHVPSEVENDVSSSSTLPVALN